MRRVKLRLILNPCEMVIGSNLMGSQGCKDNMGLNLLLRDLIRATNQTNASMVENTKNRKYVETFFYQTIQQKS